ncbi:MAG: helix-turn-helix transcriptional regulator [Desulfobaccales bacterium]
MPKQVLRIGDVVADYGLSRTSIWRKEKLGTFPKRVRLGAGRAVGWRRSDLEEWLKGLGGQENDQDRERA